MQLWDSTFATKGLKSTKDYSRAQERISKLTNALSAGVSCIYSAMRHWNIVQLDPSTTVASESLLPSSLRIVGVFFGCLGSKLLLRRELSELCWCGKSKFWPLPALDGFISEFSFPLGGFSRLNFDLSLLNPVRA